MPNSPPTPLKDIMPNSPHGNQPLRIINIGGPHAIMPVSHHGNHGHHTYQPLDFKAALYEFLY